MDARVRELGRALEEGFLRPAFGRGYKTSWAKPALHAGATLLI